MGACSSKASNPNQVAQDPIVESTPAAGMNDALKPVPAETNTKQALSSQLVTASSTTEETASAVETSNRPPKLHVASEFSSTWSSQLHLISTPVAVSGNNIHNSGSESNSCDSSLSWEKLGPVNKLVHSPVTSLPLSLTAQVNGVIAENASPTASVRARVQYPSEREFAIHLEDSINRMHNRSVSLGFTGDIEYSQRRAAANDLHSPRGLQSPMSPQRLVGRESLKSPQRNLGLNRLNSSESSESLHSKKKDISLAQHLMQRQLTVSEQTRVVASDKESSVSSVGDYVPPPYCTLGLDSPLLSFRRLPSRSRQNSISSLGAAPHTPAHSRPAQLVNEAQKPVTSAPIQLADSSAKTSPTSNQSSELEGNEKETLRNQKTERLWVHYAGGQDSKSLGKKGLFQLASDVYDDFCNHYKKRMVEMKRIKHEQEAKKGKKVKSYTMEDAERDLQVDLPLMLPASTNQAGSEPARQDFVKYIVKFLYAELNKSANQGLTSIGKGSRSPRTPTSRLTKDSVGTASFRARADSHSRNKFGGSMGESGLDSFVARLANDLASIGADSIRSPSVVVKITKMEFVLGWKRAQEALFQAIERISSPAEKSDSVCKLM